MKALKWFGLTVLGILLFISLSVFGIAFTVKSTALNPAFITKEIDKAPIAAMANQALDSSSDFASSSSDAQGIPPEIRTAIEQTITQMEPELKMDMDTAVNQVYDYLLGKKPVPELATTLRNTVLSNSFISTLIDKTPVATIATNEALSQLRNQNLTPEEQSLFQYIGPAFSAAEPAFKTQLKNGFPLIVDYLLGKTKNFSITINVQPVIDSLKTSARAEVMKILPPQIASLPQDQINAYIDQYIGQNYKDIINDIPSTYTIDETAIGSDTQANVASQISDAEDKLTQARDAVATYFEPYYIWLIVLGIVLIAGIAAIRHSVRGAARSLGSIFLSYGIVGFGSLLIARWVLQSQVFPNLQTDKFGNLPPELATFIKQFTFDVMSPLFYCSMGVLIAGVVLFVISFVYRPAKTQTKEVPGGNSAGT